jgi:hypothetical protein
MPSRDSALYTKLYVNKYLGDAREAQGRVVPIMFEHAVVAGGELIGDTVNLCVLPANCEVIDLQVITDGLVASATVTIGDSGAAARYMASTSMATAELRGFLAAAGMRYRPSADTIVFATYAGGNPGAGKVLKGRFLIVPGA